MLITKLFKHKQVDVENKICSQHVRLWMGHVIFVRNLIGDVAHQDHNSFVSDWHYRAHRFDQFVPGTLEHF